MPQLFHAEASRIVETVETRAWWDLTAAVPVDLARQLGLSIHRHGDITVATCRLFDDFVGNRAFGLHAPARSSTAQFAAIVAGYRAQRLRNYALQISPSARPEGLTAWLHENGFERRNRWAIVLRDDREAPAIDTPYEIREVTAGQGEDFVQTTAAAFGWPMIRAQWMAATIGHRGWHHYVAYDEGAPIAAGALFVGDDVGWLGMAATRATHRRRGAHTALLRRRIADGLRLGCRWMVAETGEANASYRHLLGSGFELVYWRDNYCEKRRASDAVTEFSERVGRRLARVRSAIGIGHD